MSSFTKMAGLCLLILTSLALGQPTEEGRLLRFPDIHQDKIAFMYGGDLWLASSAGSSAYAQGACARSAHANRVTGPCDLQGLRRNSNIAFQYLAQGARAVKTGLMPNRVGPGSHVADKPAPEQSEPSVRNSLSIIRDGPWQPHSGTATSRTTCMNETLLFYGERHPCHRRCCSKKAGVSFRVRASLWATPVSMVHFTCGAARR